MSGTYKATGINLKGMPMGESDRLLTVLTKEFGLIRVIAPGSRKHQSSLRGRSGLFVVNDLLIAKGKSLDKIIQAESLESYPGLGQDLRKLTSSQYLAELVLFQALSEQPQVELFSLLNEHLRRLEKLPAMAALPLLTQAIFHLLALAGVAPQVQLCCITQEPLLPDFTHPDWRIGFSAIAGGTVKLSELESLTNSAPPRPRKRTIVRSHEAQGTYQTASNRTKEPGTSAVSTLSATRSPRANVSSELNVRLNAVELAILQQLSQPELLQADGTLLTSMPCPPSLSSRVWLSIERALRHYAQYHLEHLIRSATLIDTSFQSVPMPTS